MIQPASLPLEFNAERSDNLRHDFSSKTGFDRGNVFAVPVLGSRAGSSIGGDALNGNGPAGPKPSETIRQLYDFIQQFRLEEEFIYRCAKA